MLNILAFSKNLSLFWQMPELFSWRQFCIAIELNGKLLELREDGQNLFDLFNRPEFFFFF